MSYAEFLASKRLRFESSGIDVPGDCIHEMLFPFQRDLTRWALRKGRAAIFADTGLGKTFMQIEWARLSGQKALIVAPLTVARQTVRESAKIGVDVTYSRDGTPANGITITNYEMIEKFTPLDFGAVVLDESSILKGLTSKTRAKLIDMFSETPYRLCCTATPAPNDIAEIANHAEFLGIMSRTDMLATFFVHDDNGWRLKKHATDSFFRWMASWGMAIRKPSDLGYDDDGFILPPLTIEPHFVRTDYVPEGQMFFTALRGISDRSKVRRATLDERIAATVSLVRDSDDQWIVWCGLNAEQDGVAKLLGEDCISVYGSLSPEQKAERLEAFQDGQHRVLVSKPKIAGFGMNFQNASRMVFVGLSDSWESYYQCVRRCYRFGQTKPVTAHIVLAEIEDAIYANVMAKEQEATKMMAYLVENAAEYEREEIAMADTGTFEYATKTDSEDGWMMMLGDSVERLPEIDSDSIGLSVFSPPFLSLYTYSATERDLGNSPEPEQFFEHFGYIIDELLRVTMPGRNCAVHVADVAALLSRDGFIGLKDFPGWTIEQFRSRGWHWHGRVVIDKDPQAQAIRTHSKALLFAQKSRDSAWLRPAIGDQVLVFRKPGENSSPVYSDIDNETWIEWARPIWYGIRESDTLQGWQRARDNDDERHICPLQLGTTERCVRLWSNVGDLVLDPFAGIGSTGYVAITHGRKFVGCELKESYWRMGCKNLRKAQQEASREDLFAFADIHVEEGAR